jgi:2-oxoglutarate dehydrogenase E2 component (dihydrolipoamide succinyltransferase)
MPDTRMPLEQPDTESYMAIIEVKVPQLSESVAEATLLEWHKKVGDAVTRDENLIDVETDKVVLELPAPADGVITQIVKPDGSTVKAGEIIALIDTDASAKVSPLEVSALPIPVTAPIAADPVAAAISAPASKASAGIAMPAAAKILADNNLSVAQVAGTGKDGRVTKGDVINALDAKKAAPVAPPVAVPVAAAKPALQQVAVSANLDLGNRPEQRVPMSRLRARIAERLVQSQSTNAILTTFNEVNMQPVMDLRTKYKDKFEKEHGVKLGFMSFFVKAVVAALKKYPIINASIDGNDIVYHGYFDIGIAVGSPRGLVVPILRNADQLSIAEIEKKIGEFGTKAKDGKLTLDDLTGGTFSISNGGTFGSMLSTPIINPPQSAILGVHATKDRAVVENGQIVIRPMNYLAMSYDHRIIDGREAVLGLVAMKEALEDPARLLLDL